MPISLCVFDAYGTLFDVSAAAREAAAEDGFEVLREVGPSLAEMWRQKQIGYSWLRAAYGCHTDFWSVTSQALDYALEATASTATTRCAPGCSRCTGNCAPSTRSRAC